MAPVREFRVPFSTIQGANRGKRHGLKGGVIVPAHIGHGYDVIVTERTARTCGYVVHVLEDGVWVDTIGRKR